MTKTPSGGAPPVHVTSFKPQKHATIGRSDAPLQGIRQAGRIEAVKREADRHADRGPDAWASPPLPTSSRATNTIRTPSWTSPRWGMSSGRRKYTPVCHKSVAAYVPKRDMAAADRAKLCNTPIVARAHHRAGTAVVARHTAQGRIHAAQPARRHRSGPVRRGTPVEVSPRRA